MSPVPLVFTDDPRFPEAPDPVLPPPERPLEGGVRVRSTLSAEAIDIETSRVGHPLLVKVSYHPRWRALGADGPYLVAPALMLIVPREERVRLVYGRNLSDQAGWVLALLGIASLFALPPLGRWWQKRTKAPEPSPALLALAGCGAPPPPRKWGGAIPGAILVLCILGRLKPTPDRAKEVEGLRDKAKVATEAGKPEEAGEYARAGLSLRPHGSLRTELLCLRGFALLPKAPKEAAGLFSEATGDETSGSFQPEALFGTYEAGEATGDLASAGIAREKLLQHFPTSPWTAKLKERLARGEPAS